MRDIHEHRVLNKCSTAQHNDAALSRFAAAFVKHIQLRSSAHAGRTQLSRRALSLIVTVISACAIGTAYRTLRLRRLPIVPASLRDRNAIQLFRKRTTSECATYHHDTYTHRITVFCVAQTELATARKIATKTRPRRGNMPKIRSTAQIPLVTASHCRATRSQIQVHPMRSYDYHRDTLSRTDDVTIESYFVSYCPLYICRAIVLYIQIHTFTACSRHDNHTRLRLSARAILVRKRNQCTKRI